MTRLPIGVNEEQARALVREQLSKWQREKFGKPGSSALSMIVVKPYTEPGCSFAPDNIRTDMQTALRSVRRAVQRARAHRLANIREEKFIEAGKRFLDDVGPIFDGRLRSDLAAWWWSAAYVYGENVDDTTLAKLAILGGCWPKKWKHASTGFVTVGKIVQHMAEEIRTLRKRTP